MNKPTIQLRKKIMIAFVLFIYISNLFIIYRNLSLYKWKIPLHKCRLHSQKYSVLKSE